VDETEPTGSASKPGLRGPAVTALVAMAGVALVLAIEPFRAAAGHAVSGDAEELRAALDGVGGVVLVVVLSLLHSVVFYPAEILDTAVGFVYGFWVGLALVMGGWMLNAFVAYEIGRYGARPLLYRAFGQDRFERYEQAIERGGVGLLIGMRLVPIVPFSLFTYAAGAAQVPLGRLLWTTAVGYLPITALFVYLGAELDELSPTDPILIVGGIGLVAAVYVGHRLRGRLGFGGSPRRDAEKGPDPPGPLEP
jgi:uncharacterized membrane protein YdjX (TVP38/TMEM64 family)